MFIGEGPGYQEDLQGRPFVGKAGKLLDEMLAHIGLKRESVYITNVVKCRPTANDPERPELPKDRKPTEEEIAACTPYLDEQIELIKPKIVCTLGDTAMSYILRKYGFQPNQITKTHGNIYDPGQLRIMVMFHPAAALYTARVKDLIREDFEKLGKLIQQKTLRES